MAFFTSYETDEFVTYKGDTRLTILSAAIWLIDDFTKKEAIGHIRVMIKETGKEVIKNPSGYYIFTGLALSQYTFNIFSNLYFFKETELIDTSKIRVSDVTLEFDTNGPIKGETSTKLKNVSRLQKGDVVEFRNIDGDVEQKNITDMDTSKGTISWAKEFKLKHDFNAAGSAIILKYNPVVKICLKPLPSYPFPNHTTLAGGLILDSSKKPVADVTVKVENQKKETKSVENGEFVFYFSNIENKQIQIDFEKNGHTGTCNQTLEEGATKYLKIVYKGGQFNCDVL